MFAAARCPHRRKTKSGETHETTIVITAGSRRRDRCSCVGNSLCSVGKYVSEKTVMAAIGLAFLRI